MLAAGPLRTAYRTALDALERDRIIERIWTRDHTVWHQDPTEISNRLGWLTLPREMEVHLPDLRQFADLVRQDGITDVVLLGMGGSSLGAEALSRCLPARNGLTLHVLDSTVPSWIQRVFETTRPATTLHLVASKSGTTAEVDALFRAFWHRAEGLGTGRGDRFVAITDPGSPLAALGVTESFRRVFENPADIGGRFSVLSLFGLVPAILAGVDVEELLRRAELMALACAPDVPTDANPAARLGAYMAAAAEVGRWRLTLASSDRLATFGLWAEQLVAESTGKGGTGLLPVVGEPTPGPEGSGSGRAFVALTLPDDGPSLRRELDRLGRAGEPLFELPLDAPIALGGELFRWELATAIAGHLLGIHPFDQPDVQSTKSATKRRLAAAAAGEPLPVTELESDLAAALADATPSYVALLGYLAPEAGLDSAVRRLRSAIGRRGIASTFGFGPRYLHSTGQLHKGGPEGGLFVILERTEPALPIPGLGYDFATLARAQAEGDLEALAGAGRRCLRIDLGSDPIGAIEDLASTI